MPLQEYIQPLHRANQLMTSTNLKKKKRKNHVIKLILASSRSLLKYITRIRKYHFQL